MQEWMLLLTMMTEPSQRRPMGPPPPAQVVTMTAPAATQIRALSLEERLELRQAVAVMSGQRAPELRYDLATRFYVPVSGEGSETELSAEARLRPASVR